MTNRKIKISEPMLRRIETVAQYPKKTVQELAALLRVSPTTIYNYRKYLASGFRLSETKERRKIQQLETLVEELKTKLRNVTKIAA